MLASTCPGTGVRDNLGSIIMHEFGHNLGFGHSGTASAIGAKIGSYSDGTSEMVRPL
jgi:predicted Zn-dependent protease